VTERVCVPSPHDAEHDDHEPVLYEYVSGGGGGGEGGSVVGVLVVGALVVVDAGVGVASTGACSVATVGAWMPVKPVMPASFRFDSYEPSLAASVNLLLTSFASIASFTATLKVTLRLVAVRERRFDDAATSSTFTSVMSSVLISIVRAVAMANLPASNWSLVMPVSTTDASTGVMIEGLSSSPVGCVVVVVPVVVEVVAHACVLHA